MLLLLKCRTKKQNTHSQSHTHIPYLNAIRVTIDMPTNDKFVVSCVTANRCNGLLKSCSIYNFYSRSHLAG